MGQLVYKEILKIHMGPFLDDYLPVNRTFMLENDPKDTSSLIKNKINVMEWSEQNPDLNTIENIEQSLTN